MNRQFAIFVVLLQTALVFGAPAPTTAPLKYEEAIQAILDRNPDVGTAKTQLSQIKARNLPDHLALLPTLSLEGSRSYNSSTTPGGIDAYGFVETFSYQQNVLSGTVNARMNLFHGGADIEGMRAANSEERSAERFVQAQMLITETDATTALNNLIQYSKNRGVFQRVLEMRESILRLSKERFQRGLMAEQEVDKLSVDLDNDQAQLRDTQSAEADARATLIALLGHDNVQLEWPWLEKLRQGQPAILHLTENVLSSRPDWQAAEEKLRAARQRKWQKFGNILPSLDVTGSYGQQKVWFADQPSFSGPQTSVNLTLTIPLFDKLVNYSAYEDQQNQQKLSELDFEKLKRNALAEWQSAKSALEITLQSARDRDKTLETSRRLYEDNMKRFRRGLVSANDLSVDQGRLLSSEELAVKGWNSAHTSFVRLCKAIGRRLQDCWHE